VHLEVVFEITGGQGDKRESPEQTDHRDVQEREPLGDGGHAAGAVEDPADNDWSDEAARVACHRVQR
jgi:hypothetical protein